MKTHDFSILKMAVAGLVVLPVVVLIARQVSLPALAQSESQESYNYPDSRLLELDAEANEDVLDYITGLQQFASDSGGIVGGAETWGSTWVLFEALMTQLGDNRVFEWLRPVNTVYLANGARPPVQTPMELPAEVLTYAAKYNIPSTIIWHDLDTEVKVSGLGLKDKWDQNVRYALRMNNEMFSYILEHGLFRANGLQANRLISFPDTSLELKTSWIWIDTAQKYAELKNKYYIAHAYYKGDDGNYYIGRAALSGIHIVPKIQPGWVWITFENIHNKSFTNVGYELPIEDELALINAAEQLALADVDSVLANYQLNGVQTQEVHAGKPVILANSQIESFFQDNSSCKTCHAIAAYRTNPRLEFFNTVDRSGNGTAYFTGAPPSTAGWQSMDYSWALKRAQWHRP